MKLFADQVNAKHFNNAIALSNIKDSAKRRRYNRSKALAQLRTLKRWIVGKFTISLIRRGRDACTIAWVEP